MLQDLFKDLRLTIGERLTSPLLASFVVAWCIWNYKFIVILLSKEPVIRSFELIRDVAYPSTFSWFWIGVAGPAITTAAYIFIYPAPARYVYEYTRKKQKELLDIQRKIDDETPLTIEQSREMRARLVQARIDFESEREGFQREISDLRALVKDLQSNAPKQAPSLPESQSQEDAKQEKTSSPTLSNSQFQALARIASGRIGRQHLVNAFTHGPIRTDFDIGELTRFRLIEERRDPDNGQIYYIATQDGLRLLVEQGDQGETE